MALTFLDVLDEVSPAGRAAITGVFPVVPGHQMTAKAVRRAASHGFRCSPGTEHPLLAGMWAQRLRVVIALLFRHTHTQDAGSGLFPASRKSFTFGEAITSGE